MSTELYELIQTKLFGLLYAIFLVGIIAWMSYTAGYHRGRRVEFERKDILYVFLNRDGMVQMVNNRGETLAVKPVK